MADAPAFRWSFEDRPPQETPSSGPVGQRIGPYAVVAPLGSGGVGAVYRVQDAMGRHLALKILTRPSPERVARFLREGEVTAALRHPGIVAVHDAGVHEDRPYLVYELVEGHDLEEVLTQLSQDELVRIVREVAEALGHAHSQGVLHRDVKPSNILLDRSGRALLADFGLAQVADREQLTKTGAFMGTPHYMSPEQATGKHAALGPPTDVWALGVLLYRALTGTLPFDGDTLTTLLAQIISLSALPPHVVNPKVPLGLSAICMQALQKEPAARYPDASALALDLSRAESGERVLAPHPGVRRRWTLGLAALVFVALLVAAAGVALPKRLARETIRAHAAWEAQTLTPCKLDVLGDASLDLADLEARLETLRAAAHDQPELAAPHLDLLEAHVRLLRSRTGLPAEVPTGTAGRSPEQLTVDALILRAAGQRGSARSRLERALRRSPEFEPARLAQLLSLAEDAPPQALAAALSGDPLARQALDASWEVLLERLTLQAASDSEAVSLVTDLAEAMQHQAPEARAAAARRALDASAPAWGAALEQAFAASREQLFVDRLEGILGAWGAERVAPSGSRALGRSLETLAKGLEDRIDGHRLMFLIALEVRLHYLCDDLPTPSNYVVLLTTVFGTNDRAVVTNEQRFLGALAGLRCAEGMRSSAAYETAPYPEICAAWRRRHPESRAGAYLLAIIKAESSRLSPPELGEVIQLLEIAVSGKDRDLSKSHQAQAWSELAKFRLRRLRRTQQADPRLALAISEALEQAGADLELVRRALVMDRSAAEVLEGRAAALAGWPAALRRFEERAAAAVGRVNMLARAPSTELGQLQLVYAQTLSEDGQHAKAAATAREAFAAIVREDGVRGTFSRDSLGLVPSRGARALLEVSAAAQELGPALELLRPLHDAITRGNPGGLRRLYVEALRAAGRHEEAATLEGSE